MRDKSQTGIELAVLAIMAFIAVVALYFPTFLYHFSSQVNIQYEYHYDNAQSLLLSLLSTTVTDNLVNNMQKPLLELLGEYIQLQTQQKINPAIILPETQPIKNKLSTLEKGIDIECYKLSADTDIIPVSCENGQPSKYQTSGKIPLPYNPSSLVKTITLVVGK